MSGKPVLQAHGVTHPGHVRKRNEDCFLADIELGLYLVLDGMGGHNAGDVASARACEVIRESVRAGSGSGPPALLIDGALRAASAAIHSAARSHRDLSGMGTTVVACYLVGERRALLAHVGDSRAYLLRGGRLRLLTRDHTVVAELLARGALTAGEAAVHPYKSVLSRNLGGRGDTRVDIADVELQPGDRILLCSDGMSGSASHEAMEQLLAGAEDAQRAAAELVELALRGGGEDNITVLVIELGPDAAEDSIRELRRGTAAAWWSRRELFQDEARRREVHASPICAVLSSDEAVAIVAGNLCEAVYHDLQRSAGLHVWTYAENLASGWLDQGGAYTVLRDLLDRLREAALAVVADVAAADARLAAALETDLLRALVVAEMGVAGALGERMRRLEDVLVSRHAREIAAPAFSDEKTVELSGAARVEPPTPMVVACLERGWLACRAAAAGASGGDDDAAAPQVAKVIEAAHRAAIEMSAHLDLAPVICELFGTRVMAEAALHPLLESLVRGRTHHMAAVRELDEAPSIRAAALGRLAQVHEGLMGALAVLVVESAQEVTEAYRRAALVSARLRADLARHEAHISKLERELAAMTGAAAAAKTEVSVASLELLDTQPFAAALAPPTDPSLVGPGDRGRGMTSAGEESER